MSSAGVPFASWQLANGTRKLANGMYQLANEKKNFNFFFTREEKRSTATNRGLLFSLASKTYVSCFFVPFRLCRFTCSLLLPSFCNGVFGLFLSRMPFALAIYL